MNIQARKISLIEEFLRITDEKIISKIEQFIKQEKSKSSDTQSNPMPLSDFYSMIDQAKQDQKEGKVISHQDLKKKVKKWK